MTGTLEERYNDRLAGALNCYDRVIITGTLPTVCYADGMTGFLHANGIRIFAYPAFASELRDQVRAAAASVAEAAGVTIEHIAKSHIRKESVVAKVLEQRGDHPGLVHVISAMEACDAYKPWHDMQTHRNEVRPTSGKCLHYYFYFMNAELGLVYLRVPTPRSRVDGPLGSRAETRNPTGRSIAIMCPACWRSSMAAGPDGIRDPAPNKSAASRAPDPDGFSGSSVRPIVISFSTFSRQQPVTQAPAFQRRPPLPRVIVPRAVSVRPPTGPRRHGVSRSITAEAAWRFDRLQLGQIEVVQGLQRLGGGALAQAIGQCFQPGGVFALQRDQAGHRILPTLRASAPVDGTAGANNRHAGGASGQVARLAFRVGHGLFANR